MSTCNLPVFDTRKRVCVATLRVSYVQCSRNRIWVDTIWVDTIWCGHYLSATIFECDHIWMRPYLDATIFGRDHIWRFALFLKIFKICSLLWYFLILKGILLYFPQKFVTPRFFLIPPFFSNFKFSQFFFGIFRFFFQF